MLGKLTCKLNLNVFRKYMKLPASMQPVVNDDEFSDSYNFDWLFDSKRMDHLPVSEQLKLYKQRDLGQSKLFRFGINLWETLPSRKRRLIAPLMNIHETETRHEYAVSLDSESSPVTSEQPALSSKIGNIRTSSYRSWLEQRQNFRRSIDNFVVLDDWLAGKVDKTELESRVYQRILDERSSEDKPLEPVGTVSIQGQIPDPLPTVQRPSPTAIRIIEKFLFDRQIRLIDLFQEVDKNKDWLVSREEFRHAIQQSGMPLSNADIDELIVIFDQNGTGKLNYRDLALSLKLWRLEKRELKKKKQQKVLNESDENGDEFGEVMGFELESENGKRFTSRQSTSQSFPSEGHASINSFLVIGTDPPSCSPKVPSSAPGKLETLPGVLIPYPLERPSVPECEDLKPSASPTTNRNATGTLSHSAPFSRKPGSGHVNPKAHDGRLRPPEPDLRQEQLMLSSVEEMADMRHYGRHLLRLHDDSADLRSQAVSKSGQRPAVAVIRSGDVEIDNHCAPSTLTGDVADAVDSFRQQQLKVYMDACQLCRDRGVVLSERLLKAVLLYPADKPHCSTTRKVRQPSDLLSAAQFSKNTRRQTHHVVHGLTSASSSSRGRSSVATRHMAESLDDDDGLSMPASRMYPHSSRTRNKPTLMRLSTGNARIARKVDCWLSFDEYYELTKHLLPSTFGHIRRRPADSNADWTGRLLDKLRLALPPSEERNTATSAIFSQTFGSRTHCPGRFLTGARAWPVNESGYVQYGTLVN